MALGSTAQSTDGRRSKTSPIALGRLAPDATERIPSIAASALPNRQDTAGRNNGHIHLLTDRDSTRVNIAALQQQLAERSAAARLFGRQVQALTANAAATAAKIAELDSELAWAREELVHRDNESASLQRSLELSSADNTRLSQRLADCEASIGKAYVQLEQMKAALIMVERERAKTASAADRADQKRRNEAGSLNARLEAMASCATTADKLLAGLRQNLREKLELLQNLLAVKDRQLGELKQSRSKLIERTGKLLEAFKARDERLAAAEERNRTLAARLTQAEAALKKSQEDLRSARSELHSVRKSRRADETPRDAARADSAVLARKSDGDRPGASDFSAKLLATTISL